MAAVVDNNIVYLSDAKKTLHSYSKLKVKKSPRHDLVLKDKGIMGRRIIIDRWIHNQPIFSFQHLRLWSSYKQLGPCFSSLKPLGFEQELQEDTMGREWIILQENETEK